MWNITDHTVYIFVLLHTIWLINWFAVEMFKTRLQKDLFFRLHCINKVCVYFNMIMFILHKK